MYGRPRDFLPLSFALENRCYLLERLWVSLMTGRSSKSMSRFCLSQFSAPPATAIAPPYPRFGVFLSWSLLWIAMLLTAFAEANKFPTVCYFAVTPLV